MVKLVNKVMGKEGIYKTYVIICGKRMPKTFFPQHWSREKVIEKIIEAYNNFINNGAKGYKTRPDGKYIVTGKTIEGLKLEIHITKKGKILTAYPLL